jgi:hypothetical protein
MSIIPCAIYLNALSLKLTSNSVMTTSLFEPPLNRLDSFSFLSKNSSALSPNLSNAASTNRSDAFTWQLHANASDLFVEAALDKLGDKADEFLLKKEKESNLFKGGSNNDVVMTELLVSFRDKAFK